ncbi:MAG: ion transporter [Ruminococcus sp.]|nr:ion transporter [Ruminococcus sp.]
MKAVYNRIKETVFQIIEPSKGNLASKIVDLIIIVLIVANTVIVIAETFDLPEGVSKAMGIFEGISVIIFTVEYLLRVWTSDLLRPEMNPLKARLKYVFSFMAIVDLVAILPFYLPLVFPIDLRIIRIMRVVRLFRIFKINRYTNALRIIALVFKNKSAQLVSSVFVVGLLLVIASVLMYNIEAEAQPDAFSNAFETMWWAVSTLTTVGYGDVYPITVAGKMLSTVIAFLGIGLVAVPTGIITAGFTEIVTEEEKAKKAKEAQALQQNQTNCKSYCPYCGHKLD